MPKKSGSATQKVFTKHDFLRLLARAVQTPVQKPSSKAVLARFNSDFAIAGLPSLGAHERSRLVLLKHYAASVPGL